MDCPSCGHGNAVTMKFCGECGARLAVVCPSCGAASPAGQKFCGECGTSLAPAAARPAARAPQSYTPDHLAERILTSRSALEGERKQVTILFADLKGSMELLADRDPEHARAILDPVLEHMMEAVHRYEGTVNQVMGDGIMALFGAPLAHEDHAVRACYAALRMREALARYAEDVFRSEGVPLETRVGLHSGEVVVRSIGSDLRMDYSAVGQTTHLAARMEQMARPGTILLTPDTLALAEGFVQVAPRGPVPVKGLAAPLPVFELEGASPARSRLQATASRGLTVFVGRDAEMALLRQALAQASEGRGQVMAVVGEPGVGKSRLAWEFSHSHRSQDWLLLETASVSYGKATPYFPVVELLRGYFSASPRDDARALREKIVGKLLALDRALEPTLPVFLSLLDVPVDDPEWATLDPPRRRRRTLEAVTRLMLRETQVQPVLLVVEDLHWIDAETQGWLDLLVESLPAARLLLLVNYRPEYAHAWGGKTYYHQLRIDALPAASAGALLASMLGAAAELDDLKRLLVERTQGNPFFLEESVRTLVESGLLAGERGARRLARPLEGIQVPATVQTVLAARIDRLIADDKALLQTAAVIGKDVPLVLLEAIAPVTGPALERGLERLQAAEFLYQAALFPEREYTFKHALTHEVAYGSLLRSTREQIHRRIAQTLVERFPETAEHRPELAAQHYTEAGSPRDALLYWERAGQRAIERSANLEAVRYLTQALECLPALDGAEGASRELDLQIGLAMAHHALRGQAAPEVERAYERARELCSQVQDTPQLFRVLLGLYRFYGGRGRLDIAEALTEQLHALAVGSQDPDMLLEGHMARGTILMGVGRFVTARAHLESAIAMYDLERHRTHAVRYNVDPGVVSLSRLSWTLWALGFADQSLARSHEAIDLGRRRAHPNSLAMTLSFAAMLHHFRREPRAAEELAEATVALAAEHGLQQHLTTATFLLGWAKVERGRIDEGLAQMRQAHVAYRALGMALNQEWWLDTLAEALATAGQPRAALDILGEASPSDGMRFLQSERSRRRGELLLACDPGPASVAEAEACFRAAVEIARGLEARTPELRAATSLARLLRAQGRREEARAALLEPYRSLTEGWETPDLIDARRLLEDLA